MNSLFNSTECERKYRGVRTYTVHSPREKVRENDEEEVNDTRYYQLLDTMSCHVVDYCVG